MDFKRLFDILPYQQAKYPQKIALAYRRKGKWTYYSTEKCLEHVQMLSAGMLRAGFQRGDKAGIIAHCGSPIWNLVDLALQQIGVIVVPIHHSASETDISFIIQDAGLKYCFASNEELAEKIAAVSDKKLKLFVFSKSKHGQHTKELLAKPTIEGSVDIKKIKDSIVPTDIATIIYTSGTTGSPKGVMLSHQNIVSNIKSVMTIVPIDHDKKALSYLPLSHILERSTTFNYMAAGTSLYYSEGLDQLFTDAQEVRPNFLSAVPRVLEKIYALSLETRSGKGWLGKKIFDWAISLGENFDPLERLSPMYWLQHKFLDLLVYRKLRQAFGGKVEGMVVGAAALQPKLARLYCAAGIPVREGYGLTESSPVVSLNHFEPGLYRFGTVGIPLPGVDVKINQPNENGEGEIWVKGPNVMVGYYNAPEATAEVLDKNGWLHTGDIGRFVHRRFLKITDRKRDIFKTSSGKFVAPQKVENHLKNSPFISQVMVMGLNRPHAAALIVPDFIALENWCTENNVHWTAPQFMVHNTMVLKFMQTEMDSLNEPLEPHERIRKYTLMHEEWTVEKGGLTFTLKLNRRVLKERFEKEIKKMF